MQNVSKAYKQSMKGIGRNRGYIKATIGVINSQAQKNVAVDSQTAVTYFADIKKPFNNYTVDNVYATAEQDFSKVDGTMYFLPPKNSKLELYNNGIVTENLLGAVKISFSGITGLDIKGLTIDFGEYYPVDFTIQNDSVTRTYTDNNKSYWVTEDVFNGTSYLIITPTKMVNGQGRLRIYQFYCGIVNAFSNKEVKKYSGKQYVSSITDTIPSNDISLTIDNQNQYYSPDNPDSALAYMEVGQEVKIQFGYDVLGNNEIEWLPEETTYLKTWSATDTEAKFTATDRFDYMTGKYYRGLYRETGISLYDLAIDVLNDAGITDDREYFIDPYLKNIKVQNPMPAVKHSEALQIIANAGRCVLFEDRNSKIHMQASFIPDMTALSNGETAYSHVSDVLNGEDKEAYAICSSNFSTVDGTVFFMPPDSNYLKTGYISSQIADSDGNFNENPKITINLEAAFVAYGLQVQFRNVAPKQFKVTTYYQDLEVDSYTVEQGGELEYTTFEQFNLFDKIVLEFTKAQPNSRITVDNITVGDVTDYHITRNDMTASPTAVRQNKIKAISVIKTQYRKSSENKDISTEEITISPANNVHTVYFQNPCYGLTAVIDNGTDDGGNPIPSSISIQITDSSSYYATLQFSGMTEETIVKYVIKGYEYVTEEIGYTVTHNDNGDIKTWKNPLISTTELAKDLEEWLASYYLGDVDYQIKWRGDPRTDANDLYYLELKDRGETMIRTYQNEISFNGAWSGTMKARKAVL